MNNKDAADNDEDTDDYVDAYSDNTDNRKSKLVLKESLPMRTSLKGNKHDENFKRTLENDKD